MLTRTYPMINKQWYNASSMGKPIFSETFLMHSIPGKALIALRSAGRTDFERFSSLELKNKH